MNTVGERIKEERNRLGLSQTDFGLLAGVGKTTQINYENNSRSPSAEYLSAIFTCGADIQYIVAGVKSNQVTVKRDSLDIKLFKTIIELLEKSAQQARKRWPEQHLAITAAKVYNFLSDEDHVSQQQIERTLKLIINN